MTGAWLLATAISVVLLLVGCGLCWLSWSAPSRQQRLRRRTTRQQLKQVDELFTRAEARMWLAKLFDRSFWE
jgi:hypothetical protein